MDNNFKISVSITVEDGEFWFNVDGNAVSCIMPWSAKYKSKQEWKKAFFKELKEVCANELFEEIKENIKWNIQSSQHNS